MVISLEGAIQRVEADRLEPCHDVVAGLVVDRGGGVFVDETGDETRVARGVRGPERIGGGQQAVVRVQVRGVAKTGARLDGEVGVDRGIDRGHQAVDVAVVGERAVVPDDVVDQLGIGIGLT